MDKCLVFDVWGDYGHFRKFYTTSSPLSFSIPPRTAISGMVGAILGLDKSEYLKFFSKEDASIAVKIVNPIKKTRIGINLIDTKKAKEYMSKIDGRTQVTIELLKDVRYRIYFYHRNKDIYDKLKNMLKNHLTTYTLCLGLSEYIANYKYIDEFKLSLKEGQNVLIDSIIPNVKELDVEFEEGLEYYKEIVSNAMDEKREVLEYKEVFFEKSGNPIRVKSTQYWKVGNEENVLFL